MNILKRLLKLYVRSRKYQKLNSTKFEQRTMIYRMECY